MTDAADNDAEPTPHVDKWPRVVLETGRYRLVEHRDRNNAVRMAYTVERVSKDSMGVSSWEPVIYGREASKRTFPDLEMQAVFFLCRALVCAMPTTDEAFLSGPTSNFD